VYEFIFLSLSQANSVVNISQMFKQYGECMHQIIFKNSVPVVWMQLNVTDGTVHTLSTKLNVKPWKICSKMEKLKSSGVTSSCPSYVTDTCRSILLHRLLNPTQLVTRDIKVMPNIVLQCFTCGESSFTNLGPNVVTEVPSGT
jgi:hypothetical protein